MDGLNTPLTDPVPPELDNPVPLGPLAGDHTDDDSFALDEYFEAADVSPIDWGAVGMGPTPDTLPPVTRLIAREYTIVSPDGVNYADPVMLLPADPSRLELRIETSATALRIASTRDEAFFAPQFRYQFTTGAIFMSEKHTGAVWAYFTPAVVTNQAVVAVRAVTS